MTVLSTHEGHVQYTCMPFGLENDAIIKKELYAIV